MKDKKVVYWLAPLCLMEKDPNYRGEKVFFERCPNCWKTAKELGMPEIPLLWTPSKRWNEKKVSIHGKRVKLSLISKVKLGMVQDYLSGQSLRRSLWTQAKRLIGAKNIH
ncbi:MAG: hypothetical protein ACUVQ5_00215 [Candidatus Methanomethylicaceae archaeon]